MIERRKSVDDKKPLKTIEPEVKKSQPVEPGDLLVDDKESVVEKMNECFRLKQAYLQSSLSAEAALAALFKGMTSPSALLKHEIMYVMGQMRSPLAIKYLTQILEDPKQEPIVRHEAAEALAAIGDQAVEPTLTKFLEDSSQEVADTCRLAIDGLAWQKKNGSPELSTANSVDPAPALMVQHKDSVITLQETMLNAKEVSLFDRYRALFALRDMKTKEASEAITKGFACSSALLRHEIAFVLGQTMHAVAIPSLIERIEDTSENCMVRHEAAEALGSCCANSKQEELSIRILTRFLKDPDPVVSESCAVALDIKEFWTAQKPPEQRNKTG